MINLSRLPPTFSVTFFDIFQFFPEFFFFLGNSLGHFNFDRQQKVAFPTFVRFSFARETKSGPALYTSWNFEFNIFAAHAYFDLIAKNGLSRGDRKFCLDLSKLRAEKLLKNISYSAAKSKASASTATEIKTFKTRGVEPTKSTGSATSAILVKSSAVLIVLLAFFGIGQNLVGFIYFFEFFLVL